MKRLLIVILLGCVCLLFVYRADNLLPESSGPSPGPDTPTRTWTDMLDRQVTLKQDVRRIVLLRTMDIHLLVALLGRDLDKRLVAVGNDFASNDIDGYRKFSEVFQLGHLVALGSVYADDGINPETVMGLRPDMILVDTQFKERGSVKKMIRLGLPVVFIDLNTDPFFGAPRAMRMLGRMLGVQRKADEMAAFTTMRTQAVLDRVDTLRRENRPRPVLYFEQGNTVPAKIGITDGDISYSWGKVWYRLGADNIGVGANFQSLNPEAILTRNPEVIVIGGSNWDPTSNIMRMGFSMEKIEDLLRSCPTEAFESPAAGAAVNQGCAFRGAKLALQPITDVAHLVHGPITCQGHFWFVRPTASSGSLLHRSTFITDLGEMDIIYGGEEKLARAIADIVSRHDPAAVFVYQTCLPAMIGDDISAVCKSMGARYGRPVLSVDAPGFAGGKDFGSEFAGKVLIEQVIGSREPEISTDFDIVLIGEYNVAGSVERIRSLFGRIGICILASIPGDGRYNDIAAAHRAKASVSLCSRAMVNMAGHLEDRFGLPGISGCLYGIANTSRTLINVAALLARQSGNAGFFKQARALIVEQEMDARRQLAPFRKRLRGKRALIMGGGTKTWALITAFEEIGLSVIGSMLHKTSVTDCRLAKETAARRKVHLFEDISEERLEILLHQKKIDVLFCGMGYSFAANRAGVAWVDIQHHRTTSLTGYDGLIRLAEEIDLVCHNPVFARVRRPGPWMKNGATIRRPGQSGRRTAPQESFQEKSYQANPLKISRPMGAALALLGMGNTVPLMLGARGCAMVGLIQLNRHFQRPLPIETVALDEVSFISGTTDILEHTLLELSNRSAPPGLVGLLATGMVEASGNDVAGFLGDFHRRQQRLHPDCAAMDTVLVTCPDFTGASPDGWRDAVEAVIGQYAILSENRDPRQITVLAGWQMTCGDLEEIKDILEAFDLTPLVIPDLSITSPTGKYTMPGIFSGRDNAAAGGPDLLSRLGGSSYTLAFGEHMRGAAQILEQRTGIPFKLFDRYVGLDAGDELMQVLARITGRQTPVRFRRRRNRLVETMLNVAPMFSGRKIALAGDPDHLFSLYCWLSELGAHLHCGIAADSAPILQQMPESRIQIGDLEDLEKAAQGADLLIAPSSAAPVARRLGIPHLRAGVPVTDRLASAWQTTLGYRGAWNFLCTAADLINDHQTQFVQS